MNRTPDLLITNELLYQLSYTGEGANYSPAWHGIRLRTALLLPSMTFAHRCNCVGATPRMRCARRIAL